MERRFFVTVMAADERALRGLQAFDLDLFQPTARLTPEQQAQIEGLLTLEEIGRLVEAGYRVLVEEEMQKRARAREERVDFQQWLRAMEQDQEPGQG
jgi:hypothetical protein